MLLNACDGCSAVEPARHSSRWLTVELVGPLHVVDAGDEPPWHFCCRACLAHWATGNVELRKVDHE